MGTCPECPVPGRSRLPSGTCCGVRGPARQSGPTWSFPACRVHPGCGPGPNSVGQLPSEAKCPVPSESSRPPFAGWPRLLANGVAKREEADRDVANRLSASNRTRHWSRPAPFRFAPTRRWPVRKKAPSSIRPQEADSIKTSFGTAERALTSPDRGGGGRWRCRAGCACRSWREMQLAGTALSYGTWFFQAPRGATLP